MTPIVSRRRILTLRPALVAACVLAGVALGCADYIVEPDWPPASARLVGQLGDERFIAHASARLRLTPGASDTLDLFAERWNADIVAQEWLSVRIPFTGPGTYALGPAQVDLRQLVGGDALVGSYAGSRPSAGVLVITSTGDAGNVLTGTIRFWLTPSQVGMADTASVEFTGGEFAVTLGAPVGTR